MKVAFFDTHGFEKECFEGTNKAFGHEITFLEPRLTSDTALLAKGFPAVCAFANDKLDAGALGILANGGTKFIALRSAGFNHVDLRAAAEWKLRVARVPEYSPYSVAEHATALILVLNRKIHRAYARVKELNFSLDGLVGFDLHGKTVGVVGTGKIGSAFSKIMLGFGCKVLANDIKPHAELSSLGVNYVSKAELFTLSDIISLHIPLMPETRHMIEDKSLSSMKPGVFLINTGRGALIDTSALIRHLKNGRIGAAGLDVYEEEQEVFFKDHSMEILKDDQLARLLSFPNVIVTSHQGFLTREALENIARTTLQNVSDFQSGRELKNEVHL